VRLDRFFALSLDLLYVAGFDGHFIRVNPAFERSLGYAEAEVLSIPMLQLAHPDDRDALQAELARLASGRPSQRFTNRYRRRDGSYGWFSWTATPVPEEGVFYGVARDETERLRLEADGRERARLEGALLAARTALHHMSNQLALTVGYAELLASDSRLPPDLREPAAEALQGAEDAVRTLRSLQRVARLEATDQGAPDGPVLDVERSIDGRVTSEE
jgi:PAS domain S-box-containing protein